MAKGRDKQKKEKKKVKGWKKTSGAPSKDSTK